MPFKYRHLVQLLEELDAARKQAQFSSTRHCKPADELIISWFGQHDSEILRHGPSAVAFLSCLLLGRVPHLVYGLQEKSLASVLCKALFIENTTRGRQLQAWEATGLDFATCLEKCVMALSENDSSPPEREGWRQSEVLLRSILSRLHSKEAKWFVRMILKSYSPVQIPEHLVLGCFHFLLPDILPFQNSLDEAIKILGKPELISIPYDPPNALQRKYRQECARLVTPKLGVMIKRQEYGKARSIRHCCLMANTRTMSVERKYDGWYCQIHIDKLKGKDCIQLFSKRGKDSTKPWVPLHPALEAGLRLSEPDCAITQNCILEGEMLVWSRSRKSIMPFEKIRKYIQYNGRAIGAAADSPRSPDEQLMIIFYDCLWHDSQNLVNEPHHMRRQRLEQIVSVTEGVAQIGEGREIRFGSASAMEELRKFFGHAIEQRWEGFVLKGRRDPYLSINWNANAIKLKKDYIKGLGDAADLCIVGGRRDAAEAEQCGGSPNWTAFYVACLQNKEIVQRFGSKPEFLILDILTRQTMSEDTFRELNQRGLGFCLPYSDSTEQMDVNIDQPDIRRQPPTVLFTKPFVVEVTGAAFTKPSDVAYYTLRFPRNVRLHFGRPLTETHSFEELQEMAKDSLTPAGPEEQEEIDWILRLTEADGKRDQCVDLHAGGTPSPSRVSTASISICTSSPLTASRGGAMGVHPTHSSLSSRDVAVNHDGTLSPSTASNHGPSHPLLPADHVELVDGSTALPVSINHTFGPELGVKRKREGSSLPAVAHKRPRIDTAKRALIPLGSSLRRQTSPVHPYQPPAVFRTPTTTTDQRFSASIERQPLSELKNVRTKHGSEKHSTSLAECVAHGEKNAGRTMDMHAENRSFATHPGSSSTTRSAHSLDDIILTVMSSSALSLQDVKSVNRVTMVFVQLVDKPYSKSVRNTIYGTTKAVLKEYKRQRDAEREWRLERCSNDHASQPQPSQQQRRMILFYDEKMRTSFSDSSLDSLKGAGDILRNQQVKKYFAGGLLITVHADRDEVISRAIWYWRESVRLLDELQP
ncbi:ATP dependent DNA ligase domain-containing protein [Cladophialophora immunda]|nr:ATP dependent DNA ligase domain-containing protein [Cladophialophora immunda]